MILLLLRLLFSALFAFIVGKLVSGFKLPAILGWLIAGMFVGPYAFALIDQEMLDAEWYQIIMHRLECAVGFMIGTELVWKQLKKSGASIVAMTLFQSLGTFFSVSSFFCVVFYILGVPLYLAFIFGSIALATAPAPVLSLVQEFNTDGPVTRTLIPMAVLDDIVGCLVFFTTIAIVAGSMSADSMSAYTMVWIVLLTLLLGVETGALTGLMLNHSLNRQVAFGNLCLGILFTSCVGLFFNHYLFPKSLLNFLLLGMAFSATFTNIISQSQLLLLKSDLKPVLVTSMIIVILNLAVPLDYHLIMGAGLFTVVYMVSRTLGKYYGAYFGAVITHAPQSVRKYLGFTILPHSGVSLVFTGIVVSVLSKTDPESSQIVQGTIAAAAVINEIVAVIVAKKGFEKAGEIQK